MEFPDWAQVEEKHCRWLTKACHEITLVTHTNGHKWIHILQKQLSICTHIVVITILLAWAVRPELQYSGKTEIQKQPALFWNPQNFVDCSMERSIR